MGKVAGLRVCLLTLPQAVMRCTAARKCEVEKWLLFTFCPETNIMGHNK